MILSAWMTKRPISITNCMRSRLMADRLPRVDTLRLTASPPF
jgi:hypothetical protein